MPEQYRTAEVKENPNAAGKGDEKFLALAMTRWKLSADAEAEMRKEALDDLEFSIGKQWPPEVINSRNADGRPCLTINRLPQFIRQVTNEQRQQRPAIQVNPVGSDADVDTAEIIQGIVRHVEVNSNAEVAYDNAFEFVVRVGFGWVRVLTEYADHGSEALENSEDTEDRPQEIKIKAIRNPFSVYDDPAAMELDRSDARYRFVIADIPWSIFQQEFPKAKAQGKEDFESIGDSLSDWATNETVRVAEYWYVEEDDEKPVVRCAKITAAEKLEDYEWKGKYIPIIPDLGDDLLINGKRYVAGLVRNAKDAQKAFNYWTSAATETIALAPRAPFVGAEGQFEGHEDQWRQANTRNLAYLEYKTVDSQGKPVAPPQRMAAEPPIQAMLAMTTQADANLKATTGINSASLGDPDSERSGKAVLLRQKQSDIATLNFTDNHARCIRHVGEVVIDLIPHVYSFREAQRIVKPDGTVDMVGVYTKKGAGDVDPQTLPGMQAYKKIYALDVGKYDVTVSVGPSYQTKRQEASAMMVELLKSLPPQQAVMVTDLMVRQMDFPGSKEVADRFKKMLPPQLQDDQDQDPEVQNQVLRSQLQQMSQQHELLTKTVNDLTETLKTKAIERQTELDINKMKVEAQIAIAEINTKAQETQARLKFEQDMWMQLHGQAHEAGMQAQQQQGQQQLQDSQNADQMALQQQNQDAAAQSQANDQQFQAQQAQQAQQQ